jgi:hypothetical protein
MGPYRATDKNPKVRPSNPVVFSYVAGKFALMIFFKRWNMLAKRCGNSRLEVILLLNF